MTTGREDPAEPPPSRQRVSSACLEQWMRHISDPRGAVRAASKGRLRGLAQLPWWAPACSTDKVAPHASLRPGPLRSRDLQLHCGSRALTERWTETRERARLVFGVGVSGRGCRGWCGWMGCTVGGAALADYLCMISSSGGSVDVWVEWGRCSRRGGKAGLLGQK